MKIVIAPDSYKESLSALEVATQIEAGFKEVLPDAQYIKVPVADGGEGTVEAMVAATGGRIILQTVTGPLGECVPAFFGLSGDGHTAIIEMAAASGLSLVPPALRNPMLTTSYGTGELILAALNHGARHIILGIGGSATVDGGTGMVQALGGQFLNAAGKPLAFGGADLAQLAKIDLSSIDKRVQDCKFEVACDVDNPLIGGQGAAAIFGPQKGATPEMVALLDAGLAHYARQISQHSGIEVAHAKGAGAAGGMGAAALAFLNASLRPGVEIVLESVQFAALLQDADLVITGEGRMDSQTIHGKTPMGVAQMAKVFDIPVIGIAGCLSPDVGVVHQHGIEAVFSVLNRAVSIEEALAHAAENVRLCARNIAATIKLAQCLPKI
ncbi:glycerate kinase [Iodobacter sp. HSC-16F04]|uniref:Glycerate kinase n=1 Tax=Iodobacter violaceini TaxID=3044271 RepID=A0ABX0KRH3_9NEIS|nr:glycerate kinase [Iodobacter violacea]NHQ87221.1 glycerate kinase [Iodobacter violacea]